MVHFSWGDNMAVPEPGRAWSPHQASRASERPRDRSSPCVQVIDVLTVTSFPRFRAEMFSQLGRLVWAPVTFLWSYVTLPMLLVLLTIYFLNLYYNGSPYYVSWNESMVRPLPVGDPGPSILPSETWRPQIPST